MCLIHPMATMIDNIHLQGVLLPASQRSGGQAGGRPAGPRPAAPPQGLAVGEGRSKYPASTYRAPSTNLVVMKRKFMDKTLTFCTPIPTVLRIHLFKENQASSEKYCGSISPSCINRINQLQKVTLVTGSCSFTA
jgi:hypothetical protein